MLRFRRVIASAGIGALAVVAAMIGVGGSAAAAAEYDYPSAVDPASIVVTTVDGSTTTTVNKQLRIDADWSVPDGATSGQTFGFTLPAEFAGVGSTFSIPAADDPDQTVAQCTVSTDAAPVVTCTLTDYVDGRTGVAGSLWFVVRADQATESDTVEFVVDGKTTPVAIPGGGIVPVKPLPTEPAKWSSLTDDGRISWTVVVPGAKFADTGSIVVDDELTPPGTGVAEHRNVDGVLSVWATDAANTERFSVPGWTGSWNADGTAFHVEIPGPIDASRSYRVSYFTVPVSPVDGATYANVATINGTSVRDTQVWSSAGGGEGEGTTTGRFTVSKTVTGAGASAVPAGTTYTVRYSYGSPATTHTLTLSAGQTSASVSLPVGTVVTFAEVQPPAVDGVHWGTPVFSGIGVHDKGDGTAELTVSAGSTASVSLTNTALVETPPVPPVVPPELPLTGTLASTGSDVPLPLLLTGGAIVLLGLAMMTRATVLRRRR